MKKAHPYEDVNLSEPAFEKKNHGSGGGIPALKAIWDWFDFSLLFSQCGIQKLGFPPGFYVLPTYAD